MDKEILEHQAYVAKELAQINKAANTADKISRLRTLYNFHRSETRNFQHERLIHLLVCITFGFIMLAAWVALFGWLIMIEGNFDIVTWLLVVMAALLTVLEAAYLRFYYHLENWTQRLYALDGEIYRSIQDMLKC